ncbi:uncharacterized protein EAE98_000803 [Botrytis deweyae]|uniref:Uncharacterized protein n=1 Tax=Botrytis deweyae TaxID=2478750 RepID=A0ABQ7IZS9_9HELO|nr:uncharacterized protein EAE98_000803 [Botrytis deweyae]KAF7938465.1 hypothetical protein EAE98_000803 [Botrytis deweyae]
MSREMLGICWEGLFSFNVKPTPPPGLQCSGYGDGSCDCLIGTGGIETENGENWGLGGDDDDDDDEDDDDI